MTFVVRPAREDDLPHLYEMAKLTGGGFTNLPPDRRALRTRLARSAEAFARDTEVAAPGDDQFVLVLDNLATGEVRGTCQLFTRVGTRHPFYSYRRGTLVQDSRALDRSFRADLLTLVTDLAGSCEVGGLFLHPGERAGGLGLLLARSRYLFIAAHRRRFTDRILAELRGVIDEAGGSPFWDGLAGRVFGMNFQDADRLNAVHGHQLLAELMPRHPVYTALLSEGARAAIGLPHPSGRAAMRMLEEEGFGYRDYLDIFDGGPTMTAATDAVRSVRDAQTAVVARVDDHAADAAQALVAAGTLSGFRCAYGRIRTDGDGEGVTIDRACAGAIGVAAGDRVRHVPRL